ncbi:MAG TPA: rod shape-determining protein RodA [Deltaproteobacteria bacterium]|nr:rod shape-determining protein RodA [Deltaproteobacteria bacterium]HPP80122.1 rod shape-determining protein RodA [Deltaproteobacteria bacterium]
MIRYERIAQHLDWGVVTTTCALVVIGLMSVYSSTSASGPSIFLRQLTWVCMGCVFLVAAFAVDYRNLMYSAWPFYALVLLGLVLVFVIGREISGARRWIELGPMRMQPSEIVKIFVIVWLAYWSEKNRHIVAYRFRDLLFPVSVVALPVILILLQPDLGTAGIVSFIACAMFIMMGIRRSTLLALSGMVLAGLPAAWFALKDYQKTRILTFLDPSRDPQGSGYHAIQSKIAVGSGGLLGKGFLHGTQTQLNFLPEHHTDFIFSVVAEEWGFAGSILLITLYLILITKIIDIGLKAKDRFGALICFGIASYFTFHVFINISMAVGIFPVVGVPLPFVSYGGTFMLINLVCIGLVLNVAWRRFIF